MHRAASGAIAYALLLTAAAAWSADPPRYPVPAARLRALPALEASDAVVREAVLKVQGAQGLAPFLEGDAIIPRFVARVDDVAGGARDDCPDLLAAIPAVDSKSAAALYARIYPLLQQAYEQRAPGNGYFNDRLVEAIDRMIVRHGAAPAAQKLREMRKLVALTGPGG